MSFKNYNIDSTIIAGVQGGVSGAFGMTNFGVGYQVFANTATAGIGSALKGDSTKDIIFNTVVGGFAGWAGFGVIKLYAEEMWNNINNMLKSNNNAMRDGSAASRTFTNYNGTVVEQSQNIKERALRQLNKTYYKYKLAF